MSLFCFHKIITTDEAERRGHIYDRQGSTYLFDLDYVEDVYTVDAAHLGNISHFVNHSVSAYEHVCLCPFSTICKLPQFLHHVSLKTKAFNIDVYWPACIATHILPDCNFSNMKAESVRTKSSWKTFCSFCSVTLTCRYTTCSLTTLTKGFRELRYFRHVLSEQERSSPLITKCKVSKFTEQIWVICILAQILTITRL